MQDRSLEPARIELLNVNGSAVGGEDDAAYIIKLCCLSDRQFGGTT